MIDFEEINEIFCNTGGIHKIFLTPISNIKLDSSFNEANQVFEITFRRFTGNFNEESSISRAGSSSTQSVNFFIPKKRFAVEHMIKQIYNRKIAIKCIDRNGAEHFIFRASNTYQYTTGSTKTEANGYTFKFKGASTKKPFQIALITSLIGDDGYTEGDTPGGGTEIDTGNPSSIESCCIKINPAKLSYIPAELNNSSNKSEIVTGADDNIYFIDEDGRGIMLRSMPYSQEISGTGSSFSLDTQLQSILPKALMVERGGVVLVHSDNPTSIGEYNISGSSFTLPNDWPLEIGETINIYKIS